MPSGRRGDPKPDLVWGRRRWSSEMLTRWRTSECSMVDEGGQGKAGNKDGATVA